MDHLDNDSARESNVNVSTSLNESALIDGLGVVDELTPFNPSNNSKRRQFTRNGSFIVARTGERIRRTFSLTSFRSSSPEREFSGGSYLATSYRRIKLGYNSDLFRLVTKCSVAYLIASLGVYWTAFDSFLGQSDSKHLVATVSVYFHPSRSKGSMYQAIQYSIILLTNTSLVCLACRAFSSHFFNKGMDGASYAIDLIVASTSLGAIAYMKQRVGNQNFNTACSLASILVVTCIVKEGSMNSTDIPFERIKSIFLVISTGCVISVSICFLVWSKSATIDLKISMAKGCSTMSSLLSILVTRFLMGDKLSSSDGELYTYLNKCMSLLTAQVKESKYELYISGKETEWVALKRMVEIMIALSQHLRALRISLEIQNKLLLSDSINSSSSRSSVETFTSDLIRLSESIENMNNIPVSTSPVKPLSDPGQIFDYFVEYLAPPIRSLAFTMKETLNEVVFSDERSAPNINSLSLSLDSALNLYQKKQKHAMESLYTREVFNTSNSIDKAEQEEVAACCGNFASILKSYGQELGELLDALQYYSTARHEPKSWKWLLCMNTRKNSAEEVRGRFEDALQDVKVGFHSPREDKPTLSMRLWKFLTLFKRTNVQVGLRVGLGACCLSSLAYHPKTRSTFNKWRGEWALAVYCFMINKSVGSTSMTVKWRLIGTFLGAFSAYFVWICTNGNVYALSFSGFLISILSFNIILFWKSNNAFGRIILLTFNLTALYSYSMTQKDAEDGHEGGDNPIIGEIAFHRFFSVSAGILWALAMSSFILPNSARASIKNALTILWLRLGISWNSNPLEYNVSTNTLIGLKGQGGSERLLSECETLLKQAPLEFRLKGSFPTKVYEKLIHSTSVILDSYQNINLMIKIHPRVTPNEKSALEYLEQEREELEHRIFLIFYSLASAMRLSFPLPGKPVSTHNVKERILVKLNDIRSFKSNGVLLSNEDYILFYSYILVSTTISDEQEKITSLIQKLFGDLSKDVFQLV